MTGPPPGRVELQRRRLLRARRSTVEMAGWLHDWYRPARFHAELGAACDVLLDGILAREHPRVALAAPPRHGKTVLVGHSLPLRLYALRPGAEVLYLTSSEGRAGKASRVVQRGVERLWRSDPVRYAHLQPRRDKWSPSSWETVGGCVWNAAGILSTTGGIGSHLLILDDVTGSGARGHSKADRARIWRAEPEDAQTREVDGGGVCLMETRRHYDDVRGRMDREHPGLYAAHDWPCVAEVEGQDWRAPGEYLWVEGGFDAGWRAAQAALGDGSPLWEQLYQQRPQVEGGSVFLADWMQHYADDPHAMASLCDEVALTVDLAVKGKATSDWSVVQAWGRRGAHRYLLGQWRAKVGLHGMVAAILAMVAEWRPAFVLVEDKAAGPQAIELLRSKVPGILPYSPRDSKEVRARQAAYSWASGQVWLPQVGRRPWVRGFRDELTAFPRGLHDDQVDPMTQLFLRWSGADGELGVAVAGVDLGGWY